MTVASPEFPEQSPTAFDRGKVGSLPGWIDGWCRTVLGCEGSFVVMMAAVQLWLGALWLFYWGFGIERGLILGALLAVLLALRFFPRANSTGEPAGATTLPPFLRALLIAALVLDLGMMALSDTISLRTSIIPMDEGQTSWRAARLLWLGENPYGLGALTDLVAFKGRARERAADGIPTSLTGKDLAATMKRYDLKLDEPTRQELLPVPHKLTDTAAHEMHNYGYKYGPLIVLITALVTPFGIPAAVMLLNGLAALGLYLVNWRILRKVAGAEIALAGVAMLALLLDRHITRNYIERSATDVWALLFGSLAVFAFISKRPLATAAAVALSIGCKSVPGLLFLPMLFRFRSPYPVLLFAGLTGAVYLPWLLWDARGILDNVFLWPLQMTTSNSSWEYFAPPQLGLAARVLAVSVIALLWLRFVFHREQRLFWTLATANTVLLLASGYLANNYIPWVSLWIVAAFVEMFAIRRTSDDRAFASWRPAWNVKQRLLAISA
jgi:hypothetical protein